MAAATAGIWEKKIGALICASPMTNTPDAQGNHTRQVTDWTKQ